MSEREDCMWRIHDALCEQPCWTAPYGVLTGLAPASKGGKYRVVTFGVARYLDASVLIFSPSKFVITGQGALSYLVEGEFGSVEEVLTKLSSVCRSLSAVPPFPREEEKTKELLIF